ncbi:MAG: lipoprotein [Gallionellaceae bacterium]|nr:MAG: lipoprotein [Gallionellaceae bacterium]
MKMNRWVIFAALCVTFLLSSCAATHSSVPIISVAATDHQLPHLPSNGNAIVYVIFEEVYYGEVEFDVYLDDQRPESKVGRNKGGQFIVFELSPGEHKILSKGETWAEVTVTAKAGEAIFIRQEMYFGFLAPRVRLLGLQGGEGVNLVKILKPGLVDKPLAVSSAAMPMGQGAMPATLSADIFAGIVTGGNWAKGIGFSNINIRLFVTPEGGEPVIFFVRSDSKVFDASGKQLDYLEAFKTHKKKVEIHHFVIRDATGGQPGRTDFKYEIGEKGVLMMRILD